MKAVENETDSVLLLREAVIVFLFLNSASKPFLFFFCFNEIKKHHRIVCGLNKITRQLQSSDFFKNNQAEFEVYHFECYLQ